MFGKYTQPGSISISMELSKKIKLPITFTGFGLILMVCNLHLFHGFSPAALIFDQDMVANGEWWRVITHLFVHVSWYLFFDGAAVALLWHEMDVNSITKKIIVAILCATGSLLVALRYDCLIEVQGDTV